MRRVFTIGSALAVMALAIPSMAATIQVPSGSAITLDGKNPIAVYTNVSVTKFSLFTITSGKVNIMAYAGPFKGVALANAASVDNSVQNGVNQMVIHTARFWYSDLSNWIPGYSSTIQYCWAYADVTVLQGPGVNSVGFTIRRADNGNIIASVPPMPLISGAITVK